MSYLNYFLALFQTEEQSNVTGEVTFGFSVRHYFVDTFNSKVTANCSETRHIRIVFYASFFIIVNLLGTTHETPRRTITRIINRRFQKILIEVIKTLDFTFSYLFFNFSFSS